MAFPADVDIAASQSGVNEVVSDQPLILGGEAGVARGIFGVSGKLGLARNIHTDEHGVGDFSLGELAVIWSGERVHGIDTGVNSLIIQKACGSVGTRTGLFAIRAQGELHHALARTWGEPIAWAGMLFGRLDMATGSIDFLASGATALPERAGVSRIYQTIDSSDRVLLVNEEQRPVGPC
jgi:hypothetical protein